MGRIASPGHRKKAERRLHRDYAPKRLHDSGERPLRSNESKFSPRLNLLFFSDLVLSPAGNLVRGSGLNPI